jgi:hypothetical protein
MRNKEKRKRNDIRLLSVVMVAILFSSCGQFRADNETLTDTGRIETDHATDREGDELHDTHEKPKLVLGDGVIHSEAGIVIVNVSIENNPGITALQFHVQYGEELELQNIQFNSRFGSYVTAPTPYQSPQVITFLNPLGGVSEDGLFAVMTFRVADHVKPKTTSHVRARIVSENTLTEDLEVIEFEVVDSTIVIE